MTEVQKIMLGVALAIGVGFFLVGNSKTQSPEQQEAAAMIRTYTAMQDMANKKCRLAVKQNTGTQVFFPTNTDSDRDTYLTMEWIGEKDDNFKKAVCTLRLAQGGISKLVIDDKVIIDKEQ
jgi:hypothetical protein